MLKVAVHLRFVDMVTTPATLQSPPQPPNAEPAAGVAVSVTTVFNAYLALQATLQLIPLGVLVTVPRPLPANLISRSQAELFTASIVVHSLEAAVH
jgi:hypothetical protein